MELNQPDKTTGESHGTEETLPTIESQPEVSLMYYIED